MLQMKMENREMRALFLKQPSHKRTLKTPDRTSLNKRPLPQSPCQGCLAMTSNIHLFTGGRLLIAVDYCIGIILRLKCQISAPPRNHMSSGGKLQAEDEPLMLGWAYVNQQGKQKHAKSCMQRHALVMQLKQFISTVMYQMYSQGEKSNLAIFLWAY